MKEILKSLAYSLLILVFPALAGITASLLALEETKEVLAIQTLFFLLAALLAFILYRRQARVLGDLDQRASPRDLAYFLPLLILELPVLLRSGSIFQDPGLVLILLAFCLAVGLAEELVYRGLILKLNLGSGPFRAVLVSSTFFALSHLASLPAGQDPASIISQLVLALFFGITAGLISLLSSSLAPATIWHLVHNFAALASGQAQPRYEGLVLAFQLIIMALYSLYLARLLKDRSAEDQLIDRNL